MDGDDEREPQRRSPWGFFRGSLVLVMLFAVGCPTPACVAGGGPENVLLVVNPTSAESLAIGNIYASLRGIAPINVFMLPWEGGRESTSIARFRSEILMPILRTIDARRLSAQIDLIVYSSAFPWRIDFADELPPEVRSNDRFPSASLTGLTMLYGAVRGGTPAWLDPESNDYFRPLDEMGVPRSTNGFRHWYGWGPKGELLEAGGNHYLLSVMLAVTSGRGTSVGEAHSYLRAAARADGTRPGGTIYFVKNSDIRTTTRSAPFVATVAALERLGVAAEVISGTLPVRKRDIAGIMTGTPTFNWAASGSAILPGAICENLTSFGGVFTQSAGQTPLSEFLRAGAAGSSGTVIEPFSIQAKFPHPGLQVHYARGASLAEAFYQSVHAPYQLIVVGDPLCQPWAVIPEVEVVRAGDGTRFEAGATVSGVLELEPRATRPRGAPTEPGPIADRFELFVDGIRVAQAGLGDRLTFDTALVPDGHHELRVVAVSASRVETQGRCIVPVSFANRRGPTLAILATPRQVRRSEKVRIVVRGEGVDSVVIFAPGRVLGRGAGGDVTLEVPAEVLGLGEVTIQATGRTGDGGVNAAPTTVEISD
jgi:hypothetical protein